MIKEFEKIKYILHYMSGSKGDFLCNFLNKKFELENNFNKSKSLSPWILTYDEESINNILKQDFSICCSHYADLIPVEFLEKNNCKILKLNVEEEFFKRVAIDNIIKVSTNQIKVINYMKNYNITDRIFFEKYKSVKYNIDFSLITNNLEPNNNNRKNKILSMLNSLEEIFKKLEDHNKGYDTIHKILSYKDIFVNQNYSSLTKLFPDFNSVLFESLLDKTYLPDIVNVFGYDIDLRQYGYHDY